jgi:hypothetical protein
VIVALPWSAKDQVAASNTGVHIRCFLSSDDLFPVFLTPQQVFLTF